MEKWLSGVPPHNREGAQYRGINREGGLRAIVRKNGARSKIWRTGRFTDLAQILHVNLVRGSNHEMDIFRLK